MMLSCCSDNGGRSLDQLAPPGFPGDIRNFPARSREKEQVENWRTFKVV